MIALFKSIGKVFGAAVLLSAGGLAACAPMPWAGVGGGYLGASTGMYPRVVRIPARIEDGARQPLIASVTNFDGGAHADIFRSLDNGKSFVRVGEVSDSDFNAGLCCGGLYALPQSVGALPAGTLLYAGSVGQGRDDAPMRLKIHRSDDRGETWSFLSTCYTAPVERKGGGLWEVEFLVTSDGRLACLFSDETVPGHSQILQESLSSDGVTWSAPRPIVQLAPPGDRPGMAVVSRLADGRFFMTYEICGPAHNCDVYSRTSDDGIDWGDPADPGQMITTPDGLTLRATPTNAVARTKDGRSQLIVTGQRVYKAGVHQSKLGATLFIDASGSGAGPWQAVAGPVEVEDIPADGNVCQNYSSPLLASQDGKSVLSLASDYVSKPCRTSFGTKPLP